MKNTNVISMLLVLAGASAPAFVVAAPLVVQEAPVKTFRPQTPTPGLSASAASSSVSSVPRSSQLALPSSVLDRPANVLVYKPPVEERRSFRSGSSHLVLSSSYDKRVRCSASVFSDDCLTALRGVR
jgi:hypothetical protein